MSQPPQLSRRRALAVLAAASSTLAVGCSSASPPRSPPSPRRSVQPEPAGSSRSAASATAADWRALKRRLNGALYRPGQREYEPARLLFDRRFDGVMPVAVARVRSDNDVGECLAFAQRFRLPARIRSGGHSYIGASTGPGLVIDVRAMAGVTVDPVAASATIGGGAALVDVYAALARRGVAIPAGSCPTVGLSGLALGGGVGVVTRKYGLTCDRLLAAQVVTADGTTRTCDATTNPDLYWALRGGGGSFGAVTSLTLGTHPTEPIAHAFLSWPWSAAAAVVAAWQQWATSAPRSLWSSAHVLATDSAGPPTVSVAAVMVADASSLAEQIGQLAQAIPAPPSSRFVTSACYEQTMMLEAGCAQLSVRECHVAGEAPGGTLPRDAFVAGSDFFRHPIPRSGIDDAVAAVAQRQSDPRLGAGGLSLDVLGGAVGDLAAHETAWCHRDALFNAQYTASWGRSPNNAPLARNQHSLARIHGSLRRFATGEAYQNYADDTLRHPQRAYYGGNLARLVEVRRTYDPGGVFTQPQGVPLT